MNSDTRLAEILSALDQLRWSYLVMGGHAARYYGVSRNTVDYDLHLSLSTWNDLETTLHCASFLKGRLPDGREEWLEFWRRNHLLPPFGVLYDRHEEGPYGGRLVPFLSLPDLIRSKETERESDWQDIALLEEILDARNMAHAADEASTVVALSSLRSRRGFQRALAEGRLEAPVVALAFQRSDSPMTRAWLRPAMADVAIEVIDSGMIGEILSGPMKTVELGSSRHLALVEAVRRLYKQSAIIADRADKAKSLSG